MEYIEDEQVISFLYRFSSEKDVKILIVKRW